MPYPAREDSLIAWTLLAACGPEVAPADGACALAWLPSAGPRASEAAGLTSATDLAWLRLREAQESGDPGFYTLAELAARCALTTDPADLEAERALATVELNLHRFAAAEARFRRLWDTSHHWRDALGLGDALGEQGALAEAEAWWGTADDLRPGPETADRLAHVAWMRGDLERAVALGQVAAGSATTVDGRAWALTRLGVYRIARGEVPNELGLALAVDPSYRPARLELGRWFLATGEPDRAREHLRAAGDTVEARRALAELDPSVDVAGVAAQDRRGYAIWLAEHDPAAAARLLEGELAERHDPTTVVAHGWAVSLAGGDAVEEVRAALTDGFAEPATLARAAEATGDVALARRALALPAGLLPSERARLTRRFPQ